MLGTWNLITVNSRMTPDSRHPILVTNLSACVSNFEKYGYYVFGIINSNTAHYSSCN